MTSPVNTFKTTLFGQLKSCSDAVQDAFEQRIARPLLAFKRDLSRPASTTRSSIDREPDQAAFLIRQESLSASTPLEIIDIDTGHPLKTILERVKDTFSPSTYRRASDDPPKMPTREQRHSSISSLSNRTSRKKNLRHHKSVSFADSYTSYDSDISGDNRNDIVRSAEKLADQILMASIDEVTANDNDFQRTFHQVIKPRRVSMGHSKDLLYQDLSAEIVAYVLKNALRMVEKEDEELSRTQNQEDDFIDLK